MPSILFCCPTPVTPRLGASKVYIELAEAFRRLGWDVALVGPDEVAGGAAGDVHSQPPLLREYLRREASRFDVVEYEHHALPYPRTDIPAGPVFVARSVLLAHLAAAAGIPTRPTIRARLGGLLKGWRLRRRWRALVRQATATAMGADLVDVGNPEEWAALVAAGCPAEKISVVPFGLFPERLAAFRPDPDVRPDPPRVAFVGTFDPRKGMCEWPDIVAAVAEAHPSAVFRLVGTAGMLATADAVSACFPRRHRHRIEVIPHFDPDDLPRLLADATVGAFPSYCEGFPFGVLEMLAAGLPVVAYRVPGPPMMLPDENLVPKGAGRALGQRLAALMADPQALRRARRDARRVAESFKWEEIAAATAARYLRAAANATAGS